MPRASGRPRRGGTPARSRRVSSGADHLLVLGGLYLDLAGLRPFGHGDLQPEHSTVVAGGDLVGVEVVPEDQLSAEHAARALGGQELGDALASGPVGADGQHVALDVEVDGVDVDAGEV